MLGKNTIISSGDYLRIKILENNCLIFESHSLHIEEAKKKC